MSSTPGPARQRLSGGLFLRRAAARLAGVEGRPHRQPAGAPDSAQGPESESLNVLDIDFYRSIYPDLSSMSEQAARTHFAKHGKSEGRIPCAGAVREHFLERIPRTSLALEIGPFATPALKGEHVRYADMLSTEELLRRAVEHGVDPKGCPEIHYVLSTRPLEQIEDRFASVFSSHCIEHQTDLVQHLNAVSGLLDPGSRYFVICPDKRYCFDHFLPETTIADVLEAHAERRTRHSLKSWVSHLGLTTHNNEQRHWQGDHGQPRCEAEGNRVLEEALQVHATAEREGIYLDCHAWQFTPGSFASVLAMLFKMKLTDLALEAVNDTTRNRNEFCAVLKKRQRAP
jgi:hypothetical protein